MIQFTINPLLFNKNETTRQYISNTNALIGASIILV